MSLPERILSRIEKTDTCWLWRGAIKENGYGKTSWEGKPAYSHRVVYTQLVGPIPEGLEIDHLCKVRNCVRPEHLRVTDRSGNNSNRTLKTHCKNGHELVGDNVAIRGDNGGRRCRACTRETGRRWTQRNPDKHREIGRAWRDKNREHVREYSRLYMQDFREGRRRGQSET
jgi:hypothetical protein